MKLLFELLALALFFAAYQLYGMQAAILVAIVAYSLITLVAFIKHRRLSNMQLISFVLIVVLGIATLLFQNELFFKWKPTLVYWLFGGLLLGSQFIAKQNLLQRLGNGHIELPPRIWARLSLAWVVFLAFMGALNLFVAYRFDTTVWVYFKVFGAMSLLLIFMAVQCFCLWRYIVPQKTGDHHG